MLAVDPSSPFSGGALLGDRVRMAEHSTDPGVFIRSMSSRGHLGGLSAAAPGAADLLSAIGFDVLLVETVGVGQNEVAVMRLADTVVLVLAPGMGDGIQAAKAGILEVGDTRHDRIPTRLKKRVVRGADLAEVSGVDDDLDAFVRRREFAQDLDGPVFRGVVDEQVLVVVAREGRHRRPDLLADLADVPFLVEAGREDGQQRHCGSFRPWDTRQSSKAAVGS